MDAEGKMWEPFLASREPDRLGGLMAVTSAAFGVRSIAGGSRAPCHLELRGLPGTAESSHDFFEPKLEPLLEP
jgi:hypothetical protein